MLLWRRVSCLFLLPAAALILSEARAAEDSDLKVVSQWLAKHRGADSLHLEFSQTRRMAALKNPLRNEGSMWLDFSTRRFRWQSGNPPKVVVINDGKRLLIAHPQRKRVEVKPAGARGSSGPASLAALAGGFPKTLAEFQTKYRILSLEPADKLYHLRAQPTRGPEARGIAQITFYIDRQNFILQGYHATLKDGSSAHYTFTRIDRNPELPPALFTFDTTGFEVLKP